jgi:uncharacterized protein
MRGFMFLMAVVLWQAGVSVPQALADNTLPRRTIAVVGEAEIRAVPDQVLISMTAENRNANLLEAKAANDKTVASFMAFATDKMQVEKKHIQTDFVSIEPKYRECRYDDEMSGKCNPLEIAYYIVRKGIQVRLNDLTRYETLVTQALLFGVSHIDNIQFLTTELRQHRDKARALAAKAAQEKASAIAATLGMKVAKPVTVSDHIYSAFYWSGSQGARGRNSMMQNVVQSAPGGAGGTADSFALGQVNISANVQATFELE